MDDFSSFQNLLFLGDSKVYSFSISSDMLENIGLTMLMVGISLTFIILSIVFLLHHFSCNVNLDCYRRREPAPYTLSMSFSEGKIVENMPSRWKKSNFYCLKMFIIKSEQLFLLYEASVNPDPTMMHECKTSFYYQNVCGFAHALVCAMIHTFFYIFFFYKFQVLGFVQSLTIYSH